MKMAVKMIETGALDISGFWSKGYDRDTEWRDSQRRQSKNARL